MDNDPLPLSFKRLLVVDDSRDSADSLAICLRLEGFAVRVAYGGPAAVDELRIVMPNAAILDLAMPGMDGCEVARRARELPGGGGVTLICLTAHSDDENRERIRRAGFDHYLNKPADFEALLSLLANPGGRVEASGRA
jgi:CheY-like chemotaxis protein